MPVLIDSNIILDVLHKDTSWEDWSSQVLVRYGDSELLYINPIIYGEISVGYESIERLEEALPLNLFLREAIPYEAAFLAGKCFLRYRKHGGKKTAPLPDFYIGAHAAIRGWKVMTRDKGRYSAYFPTLDVISPQTMPL